MGDKEEKGEKKKEGIIKRNLGCCWKKSETESDNEDEESSSEENIDKYSKLDDSTQKVLVYTKAVTDRTRKGFSPKNYSTRESDPETEKKKYIHRLMGFIPEESQSSRTHESEQVLEKEGTPQDYYKSKDSGSGKIGSDRSSIKKDEKQTEKNRETVESIKAGETCDSDSPGDKRQPMEEFVSKTTQGSKIDSNNNKSESPHLETSTETSKQEKGLTHDDKNDFSIESPPQENIVADDVIPTEKKHDDKMKSEESKVSEDSTEIKPEVSETTARPESESKDQTTQDDEKEERLDEEIAKKSGKAEDEPKVTSSNKNIFDKEEKQKETVDDDIDTKKSSHEEEESREENGKPLEQDQIIVDKKEELTEEETSSTKQERKEDDVGSKKMEENRTKEVEQSESAKKIEFDDKSVSEHKEGDVDATQSDNQREFMDEGKRKQKTEAIESGMLTEEDIRAFGSTTDITHSKSKEKGEDPEDGLTRKSISNEKGEKKRDDKGAVLKRISVEGTGKQAESSEKPTFGIKSVKSDDEAEIHSDDAMQSTRKVETDDKIVETSSLETDKLTEEDLKSFGSSTTIDADSKPELKKEDPEEGFKSSGDLSPAEEKKDDELKSASKDSSLDDILKLSESAVKTEFESEDDFLEGTEDEKSDGDATESAKEKEEDKDEKKKTVKRAIDSGTLTDEDLQAFGSHSNSKSSQ